MAAAIDFIIGTRKSIALDKRLCSLSQSLNLTMASPTLAVKSRMSTLNPLSMAFRILKAMFNPLPIVIRKMSMTAKRPLKVLLSLSAFFSENTNFLESSLITSRKLYIVSDAFEKSNTSKNASFKALAIETNPWRLFLRLSIIRTLALGLLISPRDVSISPSFEKYFPTSSFSTKAETLVIRFFTMLTT